LYLRENSQQFVIFNASCSNRDVKPEKGGKENKDDDENPINVGPGITESYDN